MSDASAGRTVIVTMVRSAFERECASLLIESIRSFGGALASSPIWIFEADPESTPCDDLEDPDVRGLSLDVPEGVRGYLFADKVAACAASEEAASSAVRTLIWMDPLCLVLRPPFLYELDDSADAAVRPVHIRNVGLAEHEPLDSFWRGVCRVAGLDDMAATVTTFVEGERIRSYFNSHAFSVDPSAGLLGRWLELFAALVTDDGYQESACRDERHRIFLHQAVLSALMVAEVEPERIRELPPEYNYPYNLHGSVPPERRAPVLNELVTIAYEGRSLDPERVDDIEIHEPLRSWLSARTGT